MTAIRHDTDGHPVISMYASDDEQRAFVQALTDTELSRWARQQELGAKEAGLADDRASHAHSAEIANAELANRLHQAVATDLLPDLPEPDLYLSGNGYDWIEQLRLGGWWREVAGTRDGRLLGDWPYQVVAHYSDDERSLHGLAVYTEGDVSVEGFRTRAARDKATNAYLEDDDS